jgi:hypothetical protein
MPAALFDAEDLQHLAATLDRFLPHVDPSAIALTGGVAIHLTVSRRGSAAARESLTSTLSRHRSTP